MKKAMVMVGLWWISSALLAADHVVEIESKGQGPTRDRAIQNALFQAVGQVQGVAVGTGMASVDVQTGSLDVIRDPATGSKKIELDGVSARTMGNLTVTEAKGLVQSYDVLEEKKNGDNDFEVKLKVRVYDYRSPEDLKKLRLAVMPFTPSAASHRFGDRTVSGERIGEQFSQILTTMMARNEKFTVLDRDSQAAILKEKQILIANDAPIEERMRLGAVLGADYLLVGKIPQAEILTQDRWNPAVGANLREFRARVEVEYRLVVGPTRQVVASDQLRITLEHEQIKSLMARWKSDDIDYAEMQQNLVTQAAKKIADMVSDALYPIRVAAVGDTGAIILNQGGKRFSEGEIFEVHKKGSDIVDPDTKQSLGQEEIPLATVKITKVLPRIAYATLLQKESDDSLIGGVCRRVKIDETIQETAPGPSSIQEPVRRPSTIQETPSGGVVLPRDKRGPSTIIREK
jgi:curli biogenesis system outer membrane secretion channel CsgG